LRRPGSIAITIIVRHAFKRYACSMGEELALQTLNPTVGIQRDLD
jgi:hypothetical protein